MSTYVRTNVFVVLVDFFLVLYVSRVKPVVSLFVGI